jgi:hypothetical protein
MLLAAVLPWAAALAAQEPPPEPRVDRYGDPLPRFAVARLGTVAAPADGPAPGDRGHTGGVYDVVFAPQGDLIATRSVDQTVRVWKVATSEEYLRISGNRPLAFSPDGKYLLAGGGEADEPALGVWDVATGKQAGEIANGGQLAVFAAGGKELLVLGAAGVPQVYSTGNWQPVRQLNNVRTSVALAFSPDATTLACTTSLYNYDVHLVDLSTGKDRHVLKGKTARPLGLAFSSDGRTVACGGRDKLIHLWNAETGQELYPALQGHDGPVQVLAFSPDGQLLASGGWDKRVLLWEVATGKQLGVLEGHDSHVTALDFAPHGRLLASGSTDRTVLLWDLPAVLRSGLPSEPLTAARLTQLWNQLAAADGFRAALELRREPDRCVAFVTQQLEALLGTSQSERIAQLIRDLDDDNYQVREQATLELIQMRELAQVALERELRRTTSLEVSFRIRRILASKGKVERFTPEEQLRLSRIVALLEDLALQQHGGAQSLLERLARDFPSSDVLRRAQQALERLKRLPPQTTSSSS